MALMNSLTSRLGLGVLTGSLASAAALCAVLHGLTRLYGPPPSREPEFVFTALPPGLPARHFYLHRLRRNYAEAWHQITTRTHDPKDLNAWLRDPLIAARNKTRRECALLLRSSNTPRSSVTPIEALLLLGPGLLWAMCRLRRRSRRRSLLRQ